MVCTVAIKFNVPFLFHLSLQSPQAKCQGCSVFTYVKPCQVYQCREVHYFCESCTNRPSCPVHRMSKRRLKYT